MDEKINAVYRTLSEQQREIADIVGIESFIRLMQYVNGDSIYIPCYPEVIKSERDAQIQQEFDGYNLKELARKYKLGVDTVRKIIPKEIKETKKQQAEQVDGQISF